MRSLHLPAIALSALLVFASCAEKPNPQGLQEQGEPLREALDRYRIEHGVFPESLDSVGLAAPESPFGRWRYVRLDTDECELAVGDYEDDGWVLVWSSKPRLVGGRLIQRPLARAVLEGERGLARAGAESVREQEGRCARGDPPDHRAGLESSPRRLRGVGDRTLWRG